jgi:hypothetical protein
MLLTFNSDGMKIINNLCNFSFLPIVQFTFPTQLVQSQYSGIIIVCEAEKKAITFSFQEKENLVSNLIDSYIPALQIGIGIYKRSIPLNKKLINLS